jgi:hypothetical protein
VKRILSVLAVALILAAIVVAMAMPALAAQCSNNPNCANPGGQPHGASQTFQNPSGK